MMKPFHYFHDVLTKSHLKTTVICLLLTLFLSSIPVIVQYSCQDQNSSCVSFDDILPVITNISSYSLWLIITTITTIPIFCDIMLDLPTYLYCKELYDFGVYRLLLLFCLVAPNLSIFVILRNSEINYEGMLIRTFIYSATFFQLSSLLAITQVSLYCSKWKTFHEDYRNLKSHLGNCIMYYLIIFVISHIFVVVKVLFLNDNETYMFFFNIVIGIKVLVFSYCMVSISCFLIKYLINKKPGCIAYNKLSDILHCVAVIIYGFSNILLLYWSDVYMFCLYLQISSTLLLTVIPSQVNLIRAEMKGDQLKAKLNTIRYVSHEMRTPLNISILGSRLAHENLTQLLNRVTAEDNACLSSIKYKIKFLADIVSTITSFCNTAVTTLDDVLTFDKLDEYKLTLEKQIICPLELLRSVVTSLEAKANSSGIELCLVCLPANDVNWLSNIDFSCDCAKISQIINYILSNAIKYSASNSRVNIFLEAIDVHNDVTNSMIRICVNDTGCGLTKEKQKNLFTQFVDSAGSASFNQDSNRNSGLGLWISKKIIELHGGNISVFSHGLGHGTIFAIDLPVIDMRRRPLNRSVMWSTSDYEFSSTYSPIPIVDATDRSNSTESLVNLQPQSSHSTILGTSDDDDEIRQHTLSDNNILSRTYQIFLNILSTSVRFMIGKYMSITPFLKCKYFICGGMLYYCICSIFLCLFEIFTDYQKLDAYYNFKFNDKYPEWAVASLLLLVPLIVNNIFELIRKPSSWIYSTILTIGFVVPSILNYFVWHTSILQRKTSRYEIQAQLQLIRLMLINTCLLSLTFLCSVDTSNDAYFNLKQYISNIVPLYVIVTLVSKTIFMLDIFISYIMPPSSNAIYFSLAFKSSFFLDFLSQGIALFCYLRLIIYHFQHTRMTKFESHNQLSDILHCSVISINLMLIPIIGMIFSDSYDLYWTKYVSLLFCVILFVVIPNRVNLFHVKVNKLKLKVRAHLISHLSGQMNSPIREAISSASEALRLIESITADDVVSMHAGISVVIGSVTELMNEIYDSCKVSEMTLNDMFILDQMEDQKLTIDMEIADPWTLVRSVASPFSVVARSSNINFTINNSYPDGWPVHICLHCDKFKISQVIRNLISNALKFTPAGGEVSVMLELIEDTNIEHKTDSLGIIRITVRDSGAGISTENLKKMFGQYIQFNAAQLQKGKGSGLGLWISKNIVELHEGNISVYSTGEGSGSIFTLNLPAIKNTNQPSDELTNKSRHTETNMENNNNEYIVSPIPVQRSLVHGNSMHRSIVLNIDDIDDTNSISMSSKHSIENDIFCNNRFTICRDKLQSPSPSISRKSIVRTPSAPLTDRSTSSNMSIISRQHIHNNTFISAINKDESKPATLSTAPVAVFFNAINVGKNDDDDDPELQSNNQRHILIVDDSMATRKMLIRLLVPLGFKITEAKDGWDCLKKCHCPFNPSISPTSVTSVSVVCEKAYDAILIDDSMPNMHGPEAILTLRHYGYTGIIMGLTGSVDSDTNVKFKSSGADEVLTKPLDMNKLKELLAKHHVLN